MNHVQFKVPPPGKQQISHRLGSDDPQNNLQSLFKRQVYDHLQEQSNCA